MIISQTWIDHVDHKIHRLTHFDLRSFRMVGPISYFGSDINSVSASMFQILNLTNEEISLCCLVINKRIVITNNCICILLETMLRHSYESIYIANLTLSISNLINQISYRAEHPELCHITRLDIDKKGLFCSELG